MDFKNIIIKNTLICSAIFIVITLVSAFSSKSHLGFFGYIALLLSGTFFTSLCVVIADVFRHFTKPDMFLSSGAMETFKTKIFWMIGPQVIGWIIGIICTNGFMGKVLGIKGFI
jgi:magnesium-transporting ATPase (P-type)